jgi:hypothetical protein
MKKLYLFFILFSLLGIIILFCTLFSCIHTSIDNTNLQKISDTEIEDIEKINVSKPRFNIYRFKSQLDSLLSMIEYENFHFQLNIDTINERTDSKILWYFEDKGLFKIINSKKTSQLIFYHFFDPKTSKVLRIYLIEASYNDSIAFEKVYNSFLREKDKKEIWVVGEDDSDEGEIEYYVDYGLTWLNDYVIILENQIYWLNVSNQYSKKNFNTIINYFKDNLKEKNYLDTIKCTYN